MRADVIGGLVELFKAVPSERALYDFCDRHQFTYAEFYQAMNDLQAEVGKDELGRLLYAQVTQEELGRVGNA